MKLTATTTRQRALQMNRLVETVGHLIFILYHINHVCK